MISFTNLVEFTFKETNTRTANQYTQHTSPLPAAAAEPLPVPAFADRRPTAGTSSKTAKQYSRRINYYNRLIIQPNAGLFAYRHVGGRVTVCSTQQ